MKLVEDYHGVKQSVKPIKVLEHEGDRLTHEIYEHLNTTFITPLAPHEISHLASAMDDILDYIDSNIQMMYNYSITETDSQCGNSPN